MNSLQYILKKRGGHDCGWGRCGALSKKNARTAGLTEPNRCLCDVFVALMYGSVLWKKQDFAWTYTSMLSGGLRRKALPVHTIPLNHSRNSKVFTRDQSLQVSMTALWRLGHKSLTTTTYPILRWTADFTAHILTVSVGEVIWQYNGSTTFRKPRLIIGKAHSAVDQLTCLQVI